MVGKLVQYPHYLYVKTGGKAIQAANGDWIPEPSKWIFWSMCREETNGKGSVVSLPNFKTYKFSSLIQLPKGVDKVEEGIPVLASSKDLDPNGIDERFIELLYNEEKGLIYDENKNLINVGSEVSFVRVVGECAKYDAGRLHCRLWV